MRFQTAGLLVVLAASLTGLGIITWQFGPEDVNSLFKTLFFITLVMAIWSMTALVIFALKKRFIRSRQLGESAQESAFYGSLLQGLFFSLIILGAIFVKKIF